MIEPLITNYFDILPIDIQNNIISIRNNNSANIIINIWYKYIRKKIIAAELVINNIIYARYIIPYVNVFNNHNASIIEYCNKVLSGRENEWWIKQFKVLEDFIIEHNNYGIGNDALYFNRIEMALNKLKHKFKW